MDQARATKLWLQKQFKTSGIPLDPQALEVLVRSVSDVPDPEDFVHRVIEEIETRAEGRKVSKELLGEVLAALAGRLAQRDVVQVVDAYAAPNVVYDPVRKLFHKSAAPLSLLGDCKSKVSLYINRLHLVRQRIRRNRLFRPPQWRCLNADAAAPDCELTELKALAGLTGQQRYVLGFLTQPEPGRYAIEDLSARLPVDISDAEQTHGLFTENSIVVAEGELTAGGVFRVSALGHPPAEARSESVAALQGLDFFGGRRPEAREEEQWRDTHADDRVVILSDVWLDRPDILRSLHTVLAGFAAMPAPPSLFVLMGNFQSYDANASTVAYARLREHFATLGRIINQYPALRADSRFVLVPGPGDLGPGRSLPRPGLPLAVAAPLLEAVPNAVLASNPCRVRHGASEIVLFRNDLQHKMRGLSILPPPPSAGDGSGDPAADDAPSMFDHVCATVLQQAHLCPLPLEYQPINWEFDHALFLYPMPDALVLADAAPAAVHTFDSCRCLNPGSLASGTFAAYQPVGGELEVCDVTAAEEEDEEEGEEQDMEGLQS